MAKMDVVENIDDYIKLGDAAAEVVDVKSHFGHFAKKSHFWLED